MNLTKKRRQPSGEPKAEKSVRPASGSLKGRDVDQILLQPLTAVSEHLEQVPVEQGTALVEELARRMESEPGRFRRNLPDAFHNIAMHCSRELANPNLALRILSVGVSLFPKNADLLSDLLQDYCGSFWSPAKANAVWRALEQLPESSKTSTWRYWVFGAGYHIKVKQDFSAARKLMEDGVVKVQGDQKAGILRAFEDVLIDASPSPAHNDVKCALAQGVVEAYSLGYTLATKLAVLIQLEAGSKQNPEERKTKLQEALDLLTLAESVFTNDRRHPVTDIYRARVNILMGIGNFREAIEYISAIYASTPEATADVSLKAQLVLACLRNGEPEGRWQKIVADATAADPRYQLMQRLVATTTGIGHAEERT